MEQSEDMDTDLRTIVHDHNEKVVSVLGGKFLKKWVATGDIQNTIFVATDKRLYQLGVYYERDADRYRKQKGELVIPAGDLTGIATTEKPVGPWVGRIGLGLTVIGLAILLAGLIEGSGVGLALGLFIGAVWMVVPGALMLFHAKTGGQKFLDIEYKAGTLSTTCQQFPEKDLTEFEEKLAALIRK